MRLVIKPYSINSKGAMNRRQNPSVTPKNKKTDKTFSSSSTARLRVLTNKQLVRLAPHMLIESKNIPTLRKKQLSKGYPEKTHHHSVQKKKLSRKVGSAMMSYHTTIQSRKGSPISTPVMSEDPVKKNPRQSFRFLYQIGSGGFGSVWKVQNKKTQEILAMKEISKAKVIMKKSVNSIMNQKLILDELSNAFIINQRGVFQDREYLYLKMEYLRGGDLRYHLCHIEQFTQEQTKFILGCIILSLEYIHSKKIIHRDLKPQNLVFEENGYLRLTDFGVARKNKNNNSYETSGTPGYMAPEVICKMNHSFEADYFALGVIAYEMVTGKRPYQGDCRREIREKILGSQAKISHRDIPTSWDSSCVDFVNKLLKRNKQNRLGYGGVAELKEHPWFHDMDWTLLANKQIMPPFRPGPISQTQYYQQEMQNTHETTINQETMALLRTKEIQALFKEYCHHRKKKCL